MTYPAGYNKKNTDDNSSSNDDNIHPNNTSSNNSSNPTTDKNNNNITRNVNPKNNNKKDDDDSTITIKRSTFTKLAIIGVAALMVSSFFAGYTLHQGIAPLSTPTYVTLPSSPSTTTANSTMPTTVAPPSAPPAAPTTIPSVSLDDDPMRGNKDAPITLVEFSDFQCPFCKRTFDETIPEIKAKYIDTGKIKHVYRDYPVTFLHQNAIPAAIAADCANEQGKFWDYHDILFTKQTEWENLSGNATNAKFKEYAATNNLTGIDTNKFNACVDSQKYKDEVDKDIADGSTYGVSGTPTFYIGNEEKGYTQIVGAQPLASFESEINKLDSGISDNSTASTNNNATNT